MMVEKEVITWDMVIEQLEIAREFFELVGWMMQGQ